MPTLRSVLALALAPILVVAAEPERDLPLDPAVRDEVVTAVARHVEENYLFAERARDIAAAIRVHDYTDVTTGAALAERLTADLQAVAPDRHLKVLFSAEPRPLRDHADVPSAAEREHQRLAAIRQNFGLERLEHLDGNVGYLKLKKFADPALAGDAIVAAMQFLSNTDALLIDLRLNGGGHGETVELLTSYLVDSGDGPVHLADFATRQPSQSKQSWTLPYVPGRRYLDKPVYLLTSTRTFSAAEGFAYTLQAMKRATVVGERTGGGAHFVRIFHIDAHYGVMVPVGAGTSTFTGTNWQGTGITPDVEVPADAALRRAHLLALRQPLETTHDDFADHLRTLIAEMEAQP